jgi:hypothetical protein
MITIIDYKERKNAMNESFFALILQGGISMVQSKETGNYYATSKKATITSTFDEQTCKALIGTKLSGNITKVPCEPYSFIIEQTGEEVNLDYKWQYEPEHQNETEKAVFGQAYA